ncbi:MAG: 4-hydroxybenzoate octaprenyltransferase [Gammaproteobacteria bacterium]|jgi:4-hydroxybenzoate polyprenyltransferase|nr:4-hydroxybenzoate octaprenyltransferase [Gammaproteobacteria bacterium]|tara:strand:+ start:26499 stop:27407 length:909 start_codon:yes stop_codon:yes gene_type:complete
MHSAILSIKQFAASLLIRHPKIPFLIALTRLDRPIGIYLLLWPTLWALWMAAEGFAGWHLFLVFTLGTVLTRSAGCIINDIADRNFDGQVKRTRGRPLVSGDLVVQEAFVFLGAITFCAFILVLSTNIYTVGIAFFGAAISAIYPFMKRYTYLPQVILGVAFSCGIPMAFTATHGSIPQVAWLLIIANLVWTVAYDTQYAMVDRDDDIRLGLKSSAILFAELDRLAIGILQVTFLGTLFLVGRSEQLTWPFYIGLLIASGFIVYQQFLIRNREREGCFNAFLNNHLVGLSIFLGLFVHYLLI